MKILITGSNGFIGKNLLFALKDEKVFPYDREYGLDYLRVVLKDVEFIFHLAAEIKENFNTTLTEFIMNTLGEYNHFPPIVFTSTIQTSTPYAENKTKEENILRSYKGAVFLYKLPNVFGRWCRPNYNSAVATFLFNTEHGLPLTINDRNSEVTLVYVDDVVREFTDLLYGREANYPLVKPTYKTTVGEFADVIRSFRMNPDLLQKLFKTYNG